MARRIRGRTTDLIAIAVVVVACLTMGRRIVQWWNTDPPTLSNTPESAAAHLLLPDWNADGLPVTLEFGDRPLRLERHLMPGDLKAARDAMLELVESRTRTAGVPAAPPDDGERSMLRFLDRLPPVRGDEEDWAIYHAEGPLSLFVGIRGADEENAGGAAADEGIGDHLLGQRVVCWGFLFPQPDRQWVAYLFEPAPAAAESPFSWRDLVPDRAVVNLSLATVDGDRVVAFEGRGTVAEWRDSASRQMRRAGLIPRGGWHPSGAATAAVFVSDPAGSVAESATIVSIQLFEQEPGELTGLLQISPTDPTEN